ncbi:glutamyl-tRNA synthetase [Candidatus Endolissoclinum faulkneri L5]|uniref:Glutamyl-tRNA synthetase n=1 Tax=Candidatus Endolissoclinum faulkneri L5 TaxID=1401328 RepID=V9TS29_9PROT|nr:UDP-2,3-diacylglucosamine diphosphatase LpxI [Candidatus Endolissoclinum faulkneri]AHC73689.1 glutamyl-tRNA synthetase [Candidatus Endolissoclinum faulkneri L5]
MTAHPSGSLGILAGRGILPRRIAEIVLSEGRTIFVVAFNGQTDPATVDGLPHAWLPLGATTKTLKTLHKANCSEVVMAGSINRPALSSINLDLRSTLSIARAGAKVFGDNGLLSLIVEEIKSDGIQVISIEDILGGYLIPEGTHTKIEPNTFAMQDAARGIAVLKNTACADIGQAVVVQEGIVLAVEAIEGTDSMINRAANLRRKGTIAPILIKGCKSGQSTCVDRATIGPTTISYVASSGFAGIVVETLQTLIIDRYVTIAAADAAGIFLHAMSFDGNNR